MVKKQKATFTPKKRSLLGTLPEIRVRIYELVFSTTILGYHGIPSTPLKGKRDLRDWKTMKKETSVFRKLGLPFVCKKIHSEITPALLSMMTFNIQSPTALPSLGQSTRLSMQAGLAARKLVLHNVHLGALVSQLRLSGFPHLEQVCIWGREVAETGFRIEDGSWHHGCWAVRILPRAYIGDFVVFDDLTRLESLPCDFRVQFDYVDADKVFIGTFKAGDTAALDFSWTVEHVDNAIVPARINCC